MIGENKILLILPRINIHNANALSSPFTIGFPAMSAWMGAVHALERNIKKQSFNMSFRSVGVICHDIDLQTYKGANDYVWSIVGTGNPLERTGERAPFIEEARCHLTVSLVIEIKEYNQEKEDELITMLTNILNGQLKIAGGDILGFSQPYIGTIEESMRPDSDLTKLTRRLMPGYALIERRDLMIDAMESGEDALDALLNYLAIHNYCEVQEIESEDGNVNIEKSWVSRRKTFEGKPAGWIVPIATGFHGVTDFIEAKNQRDPDTPHRFCESLVTLGEFKMLHRFKLAKDLLWKYSTDLENQLYLCQQHQFADKNNQLEDEFK